MNIINKLKDWQKILIAAFVVLFVVGVMAEPPEPATTNESVAVAEDKTEEPKEEPAEPTVAEKVTAVLDKMDAETKDALAATSIGGYQGEIVGVEPYSDDGVNISVSTHYEDSGDDGGKNIAWKIFSTICSDVPELESVYVTSTSSGLESRSVYRSSIPACST